MIVFDFDKTLIDHDSLFGFYRFTNKEGIVFRIKHKLLILSAILYKTGFLTNTQHKRFGVFLFLKGKTKDSMISLGAEYSKILKLNSLYTNCYLPISSKKRLVISASLDVYLIPLFGKESVLSSSLSYVDGKVNGLAFNCYSTNKVKAFKAVFGNMTLFDLYTDSESDRPLMNIAKNVHLVKNGEVLNTR